MPISLVTFVALPGQLPAILPAMQPQAMHPERVWYVAYGSNVNETRFMRYLAGDAGHVGARDATPPVRSEWSVAPLQLRFAGQSQRWNGGGVCFVDPDPGARAHVRAWDISREQFEDVFAQENRGTVGTALDWQQLAAGPAVVGTRWYAQLVPVNLPFASAEQPAWTFTWTTPLPPNRPDASYRDTIARGLALNPDLTPADIDAYLEQACTI